MARGLLISGNMVPVAGLEIVPPVTHGGPAWARLEARDHRRRPAGAWVRQIIVHTTLGVWPHGEPLPGGGGGGRDKQTADYWHSTTEGKAKSGGAHLVVDNDGSVACLCDLARVEAYHATVSNAWSIGIEMYKESGVNRGRLYEAVLDSTVKLVTALCAQFAIPMQIPGRTYPGAPLQRLVNGGPDAVGIFGHRDNTNQRGRGDPGDEIFRRLALAGAERLDYDAREDIAYWKRRQAKLNALGEALVVDGIAGPKTIAAMRRRGFASGAEIDAGFASGAEIDAG